MRRSTARLGFAIISFLAVSTSFLAAPALSMQTRDQSEEAQQESTAPTKPTRIEDGQLRPVGGKVANSAAGRAGERQNNLSVSGILPTARAQTRIANRVQARLRNRIDRYYDPQANSLSPFKVAGDTLKRTNQGARR